MIYGMLIGICFASLHVYFSNPRKLYEDNEIALLKSKIRIACIFIFAPAAGALIGLLIRGA